jgi:hypothetical protein
MTHYQVTAHGIGGRQDLPIPLHTAIIGAVIALLISFTVLAVTTRRPDTGEGRDVPVGLFDSTAWRVAMRVLGMVFFAFFVIAALGPDKETNPIFGVVYVWWWVGVVYASLLFGPVWRAVSPVRTIHDALVRLRGPDASGEALYPYSERIGYWPAAVGLLAFTWLELVYPNNGFLGPVRLWCVVYGVVMVLGGQLWGERFFERCDPFEVYSSLAARVSVWGHADEEGHGRVVVRSPLRNLDRLAPEPGLVAVTSVLFGTLVFDSFKESTPWLKFTQGTGWLDVHAELVDTVALVAFPCAVALFFVLTTMATGVETGFRRRRLPGLLAPSMVPIIAGYVVAHYLSFWWAVGELTLIQASDPWVRGEDWFGTAHWPLSSFWSEHTTTLADVKVAAVILGHIGGVVVAHRIALRVLPRRHVVTGQLPLLVTMVGFTVGGLYLLFSS